MGNFFDSQILWTFLSNFALICQLRKILYDREPSRDLKFSWRCQLLHVILFKKLNLGVFRLHFPKWAACKLCFLAYKPEEERILFWPSHLNDKSIPNICSLVYRNVIYDDPLCGDPVLPGTRSYSGHGVQRKCWYLECGLYHGWNDTWWGPFSRHWSYWPVEQMFIFIILTFLADFLIPIFFSNLNSNCSNYLRNLQEQFKKAFCNTKKCSDLSLFEEIVQISKVFPNY